MTDQPCGRTTPLQERRENRKLTIACLVVLVLIIWGGYAVTAMVHSAARMEAQPTPATAVTNSAARAAPTTGTPIPTDTAAVTRSACQAPGSSC